MWGWVSVGERGCEARSARCPPRRVLFALGRRHAGASAQPVELAAPYEYLGWGDPQPPAESDRSDGVKDLTLAFVLSHGSCNPRVGRRAPAARRGRPGGDRSDPRAGGDVDVSFGGWSGKKLGSSCKTPAALAAAYQKVIDAYSLPAIDIDIEQASSRTEDARTRHRGARGRAAREPRTRDLDHDGDRRNRARKGTGSA